MPTATSATTLKPIPEDFTDNIVAAVDSAPRVDAIVGEVVGSGITSVFLVGCGGSLFSFGPVRVLLDRSPVPVYTINSDEFVNRRPAALGPGSFVVVSSTNGGTAETARAAALATAAGATVIGVAQDPNSVVAAASPTLLLHQGIEAKQVILAEIGWSLLRALGVAPEYDAAMAALRAAPEAFLQAIHETDAGLGVIAQALHQEPIVYVLGSGPLESAAYTLAMCYLQEMQWKHAVPVGSGEFLHGPFEMVTEDLPVIVLTGEDATRPMGDRVSRFLERYTPKVHHLDAAGLSLPGIEPAMRPFIGTLVVASTLVGRLAEHFEAWSGHSLTERRYMWKVEY
jgi:fructoselysine-6-P-deglycase FrlB-like protein